MARAGIPPPYREEERFWPTGTESGRRRSLPQGPPCAWYEHVTGELFEGVSLTEPLSVTLASL